MESLVDLSKHIQQAWLAGRAIIPLVGAGLSVDSGMPAIQSIVRYVAKLHVYLKRKLYLPLDHAEIILPDLAREFERYPWRFIEAFGWPDRFQLNFDVRRGLQPYTKSSRTDSPRGLMTSQIGLSLDELALQINPGGAWRLKDYLRAVEQGHAEIAKSPGLPVLGPSPGTDRLNSVDSFMYQVSADWKPLLREITGHKQELIDALFGRLSRNRGPGLSHCFLAHLCNLLRVRTILTFNFDPLIEIALSDERLNHRVFAMEHGTQLPSLSLLDDSISVIKMHGSTHNILVDERVDYRISADYRRSFQRLVGHNPLLLVLGCSGNDRRLRELVRGIIEDSTYQAEVVWLHRAENNDVPKELLEPIPLVKAYPTFDVGQTLRFLYTHITERLPTGNAAYPVHFTAPLLRSSIDDYRKVEGKDKPDLFQITSRAITIFSPKFDDAGSRESYTGQDLMRALARVSLGYTKIWLDLEEQHSLGQVAAEIISQIRRGDIALNSFVSPVNPKNAAMRVYRALRRSRYVLVIANIDAYVWRATTHHGVTKEYGDREYTLLRELHEFLENLRDEIAKEWEPGDSCLVLHFEHPYARHDNEDDEKRNVRELIEGQKPVLSQNGSQSLKRIMTAVSRKGRKTDSSQLPCHKFPAQAAPWLNQLKLIKGNAILPDWQQSFPDVFDRLEDKNLESVKNEKFRRCVFLTALCCIRRTRVLTTLSYLRKELRIGVELHELLKPVASDCEPRHTADESPPFTWTEGAGLWCDRPWRDAVYDHATRFTSARHFADIKKSHEHAWPEAMVAQAVSQLTIISALHDIIARQYYLNAYLPSHDAFICLEYVYHRISTLRYLAALEALLRGKEGDRNSWHCGNDDSGTVLQLFAKCYSTEGDTLQIAFGPDWSYVLNSIAKTKTVPKNGISMIRARCMRGLAETWKRAEAELRCRLSSDQLIKWCETILEYDLKRPIPPSESKQKDDHRPGRLCPEYYYTIPGASPTQAEESDFALARDSFEEAVYETLNKAYYERGDFELMEDCAKIRKMRTGNEALQRHCELDIEIAQHWKHFVQFTGVSASTSISPTLDIPASASAPAPIVDATIEDPLAKSAKVMAIIAANRDRQREKEAEERKTTPQAQKKTRELGLFSECHLRAEYLCIEKSLAVLASLGQPPGFTAANHINYQEVEKAIEAIEKRLEKLRINAARAIEYAREEHTVMPVEKMRSPLLEATRDHGLFIPYRSLFQILLGRIQNAEGFFRACKIGKSGGEDAFRSYFVDAFRELASARSGLGPENSILLAITDVSGAEAALTYVKCLYVCSNPDSDPEGEELLGKVDSKLRTASGYLSQATVHLTQSPHYVLVWRYLHTMQVQYHLERTIWNMLQAMNSFWRRPETEPDNADPDRTVMEGGRLLDRARKGLAALRNGLDYSSLDAIRFKSEWTHQWGRLGCAAIAGAMVRHGIAENAPFRTFKEALSEDGNYRWLAEILADCWEDLNASQGISPSRGFLKKYEKGSEGKKTPWGRKWIAPLFKGSRQPVDGTSHGGLPLRSFLAALEKGAPEDSGSASSLKSRGPNGRVNKKLGLGMRAFLDLRQWLLNDAAYQVLRLDETDISLRVSIG